jgi:hypothetical protein
MLAAEQHSDREADMKELVLLDEKLVQCWQQQGERREQRIGIKVK